MVQRGSRTTQSAAELALGARSACTLLRLALERDGGKKQRRERRSGICDTPVVW